MSSDSLTVREFIQDPSIFDTIVADYEDDADCYNDLRDEAKKSLSSFDEYLEFYATCIERGPKEHASSDLERNAVRSLKNMVLGSSTAGRRFPIVSAADLQHRIDSYQELGVESVTPRTVTYTIIEHILDDSPDESQVYVTLDHLLTDQADKSDELVTLLSKARFVFAAETLQLDNPALEIYLDEFCDDLPDPLPDDNRTPAELLAAADEKPFTDSQKIALVQASLARQPDEDALQEYLYLTARDTIERYRHQDRDNPWRGELQLAVHQFNCLENIYQEALEQERTSRIRSYRQLALAELKSGGRWQSLRDPNDLPEPKFLSAGKSYYRAANEIKAVDPHRYIKYLSKAFRNQAVAARYQELGAAHGWYTTRLIHDRAISLLTQYAEQFDVDQDNLTETIVGAVGSHKFRKHQAAAVVAFEHRNPEQLASHLNEAWDHLDATPTYENTDLLESLRTLSKALSSEIQGQYEEALRQYKRVENTQIDIEQRIRLVEIKQDIAQENYQSATYTAKETFENGSPIITAVQLIAGESADSPSVYSPLFKKLSAVDPETKWWFAMITFLSSSTKQENKFLQNQVKETLFEL
jgi:hypothetical protein